MKSDQSGFKWEEHRTILGRLESGGKALLSREAIPSDFSG
jgi:hypothetical protein